MSARNYLSTLYTCLQHQDEQQNEQPGPEGTVKEGKEEKEEVEEVEGLSASLVPHDNALPASTSAQRHTHNHQYHLRQRRTTRGEKIKSK